MSLSPKPICEYIDRAKWMHGMHSDRQLSRALGLAPPTVHMWRHGKKIPSDKHMIQLAFQANENVPLALIDLSYWKNKDEARVSETYSQMRSTFSKLLRKRQ